MIDNEDNACADFLVIPRASTQLLHELMKGFPIVTLTGPRQAGKTTLARARRNATCARGLTVGRARTWQLARPAGCNWPTMSRVSDAFPRFITDRVLDALEDTPVVLIHGPRQCGKSTLAQAIGATRGYAYLTFDDAVTLAAAHADPVGFVEDLPQRVILDEVQRAPALFIAIKRAVDRNRTPGRFLLTGSANILLLPNLADSLAGRMGVIQLHPLAQSEIARHAPTFLPQLLSGHFPMQRSERLGKRLAERIVAGGYPPALARASERRRATWYRDYIDAIVQRDVQDLARITALDTLPRLLTLAAAHTSRLVNISELARTFQRSRATMHDYLTLLERVFLLERLAPWHRKALRRLIKTPKIHLGDTGVASALLGLDTAGLWSNRSMLGPLLETFAFQELRRQASWLDDDIRFSHYRDKEGVEVDLVIERAVHQVFGIEVKAAATVTSSDFRGLRKLKAAAGNDFVAGVMLYDGDTQASFGEGMYAVPISLLWATPRAA